MSRKKYLIFRLIQPFDFSHVFSITSQPEITDMKRIRLRYFIRNLKRYNGIAILNIAGLSLGLASVLFISLWIKHETLNSIK